MSRDARRWGTIVLVTVVVGGSVWLARRSYNAWRAWRTMVEVREEVEAGRHATAARKLIAFLAERPDSDEAAYLLGNSEMARGSNRAAAEAWARVRPDSPFAPRAIQRLMELEVAGGRFAVAEQVIKRAMDRPGIDATALPLCLGPIYWVEGRVEDAEQSVERRWADLYERGQGASEKAIDLVRLHIDLGGSALPVDLVRDRLETVGRMAPDDDRVWLGKANLAIRTGSYDEAEKWLVDCLKRRPDDVPVWRARLNLAVAASRVTAVMEALKHLPVDESKPAQVPRLAAWLAARRGDRALEQHALERVIAAEPADFGALDRLADVATEQGEPARAAELRQQKTEIIRLQARFQKLYQRNQSHRDAAEFARIAKKIGRPFEARAFKTLAIASSPNRDELQHQLSAVESRLTTIDEPGRTLAEAVAADDYMPSKR
jgi:enediyne biosynthesis protein E4